MTEEKHTKLFTGQDGITWKYSSNPETDRPILVLFHGWSGDENSMWVFSKKFNTPPWHIFSPRGILETESGGFGWTDLRENHFSNFIHVAETIHNSLQALLKQFNIIQTPIHAMGFSQGGALLLVLSILYPATYTKAACLSGYMPQGSKTFIAPGLLSQNSYYIAHGTNDQIVPFPHSLQIQEKLKAGGASVQFCRADVGHKVDAACFRDLGEFFLASN